MFSFSLAGLISLRHVVPSTILILCAISSSTLHAEESAPVLLEKLQENSFSIESSTTISSNRANPSSDSRAGEIGKRLKAVAQQFSVSKEKGKGRSVVPRLGKGKEKVPSRCNIPFVCSQYYTIGK